MPVGMYVYSLTCLLILTTSTTAILNSTINSYYPLDTALVLTSDNSIQFFPHPLHSTFFLFLSMVALTWKLSPGTIFTVCSHTFIFFWLRKTSVSVRTYHLSFHVFICAFYLAISPFFHSNNFLFLFLFLC